MMSKIDYKNRALLMSSAYSPDGTSDVELYFDRFDKIIYFTDLNGGTFYTDGTAYLPTPIPDANKLIYCSLYNGIVGLKFTNPVLPSSIIPANWSVVNGSITYANSFEDDTLILFTMENSDTLLITTNFENMVGDITQLTSIAALPLMYKAFDSQEQLCEYYGINGQSMPDADGTIYMDFSTQKSYLDPLGRIGVDALVGKWLYLISTSVPNDVEGNLEPVYYWYSNVETTTIGVADITEICE